VVTVAVLVVLQPAPWMPRYSLAAIALVFVLVGIFAQGIPRRVLAACSLIAIVATLGLIAFNEKKMSSGFADLYSRHHDPAFNSGPSGPNSTYQSDFSWTAGLPCGTTILVPEDAVEQGRYGIFNLALMGDELCNRLEIGDAAHMLTSPTWDFAVVRAQDVESVIAAGRRQGVCLEVVAKSQIRRDRQQAILHRLPQCA